MIAKGKFVCLCGLFLVGITSRLALGQGAIPLERAINDSKVEVEIAGIGGSTGDTILITVRRKMPEVLRLTLTPGTVFKSVTGTVQNMAGAAIKGERVSENSYRPATEIILIDNDKHSYVVEAYCLDFHKGNPGHSDSFSIALPDGQVLKILRAGKAKGASIQVIQAAVWIDRDGTTATQLKERFPVGDGDIEAARTLLRDVKQGVPEASNASATPATPRPGVRGLPTDSILLMNIPGAFQKPRTLAPDSGTIFILVPLPDLPANTRIKTSEFHFTEAGTRPCVLRAIGTGAAATYVDDIRKGTFVFQKTSEEVAVGKEIVVVLAYQIPKDYKPPLTFQFRSDKMPVHLAAQPQGNLSDRQNQEQGRLRTWTDGTGKLKTDATFLDFKDSKVRLTKKDGSIVSVPLENLSKEDQDWVASEYTSMLDLPTSDPVVAKFGSLKPGSLKITFPEIASGQLSSAQIDQRINELAAAKIDTLTKLAQWARHYPDTYPVTGILVDSLTKEQLLQGMKVPAVSEKKGECDLYNPTPFGPTLKRTPVVWLDYGGIAFGVDEQNMCVAVRITFAFVPEEDRKLQQTKKVAETVARILRAPTASITIEGYRWLGSVRNNDVNSASQRDENVDTHCILHL